MELAGDSRSQEDVRQAGAVRRPAVSRVRRRTTSSLPRVLHVHSSGNENTQFSMLDRVCSGLSSRNGDIPLQKK